MTLTRTFDAPRAIRATTGSGSGLRPITRLRAAPTNGRASRGKPRVTMPLSNVTGRSSTTTWCSVSAQSWIIGLPCTSTSTLRRTRPAVSSTV